MGGSRYAAARLLDQHELDTPLRGYSTSRGAGRGGIMLIE